MSPPLNDRKRFVDDLRRSDPRRDPSDPPPSSSGIDIVLERQAKRAGHAKTIIASVIFVITGLTFFVVWVQQRPSKSDVAAVEDRAMVIAKARDSQLQEVSIKLAVLQAQVELIKNEQDRRWNNLDTILRNNFGADTNNPAPPAFGNNAKRQGR